MINKRLEIRGIPKKDIALYLFELGASKIQDSQFEAFDWSCQIKELEPLSMFHSVIYRVEVHFHADTAATLTNIIKKFRIKTFRIGG